MADTIKPDALAGDAAAIEAVRDLAVAAAGEFLDLKVAPPAGAIGLPAEVTVLARHGRTPEILSLRPYLDVWRTAPERRKGCATVTTLQSFIDLVSRHKDADSALFARTAWPEPKLTAVLDYHTVTGGARFGEHRVTYAFPLTDEFKAWVTGNGKPMEQREFAVFLEDHVADLAPPLDAERSEYEYLFKEKFAAPNELVMLARSLEIFVGAKVKRAERLASGERTVEFVEEHTGPAGEKVDIPGIFMVATAAFIDGDRIRLPARLRYRVASGSILWSYQLYRWEFWLRAQVQNDLAHAAKATGLPAFEGAPET
jgi:uncharacterized protein YfdQ (DUF2303 family)